MTRPDDPQTSSGDNQPAAAAAVLDHLPSYGLFQRTTTTNGSSQDVLSPSPACLACVADASSLREQKQQPSRRRRRSKCVFWRKVIWSPQGSHLLTQSEDHHVEIFAVAHRQTTPHGDDDDRQQQPTIGTKGKSKAKEQQDSAPMVLRRTLDWQAPSPIVSVAWHPFALASSAITPTADNVDEEKNTAQGTDWAFVVSCRDTPIKVVDANTGQALHSFGIESHTETFLSAHSFAFHFDAAAAQASPVAGDRSSALELFAGLSHSGDMIVAPIGFSSSPQAPANGVDRLRLGLRAGHSAARKLLRLAAPDSGLPAWKKRRIPDEDGGSVGRSASRAVGQRGILSALCVSPSAASHAAAIATQRQEPEGEMNPMIHAGNDTVDAEVMDGDGGDSIVAMATLDGSIGIYGVEMLRYLARRSTRDGSQQEKAGPAGRNWDPHRQDRLDQLGVHACLSGFRAGLLPQEEEEGEEVRRKRIEADQAVSQIEFHPTAPHLLFVTQRRYKDRIVVYDLRYLPSRAADGVVEEEPVGRSATELLAQGIDFDRLPGPEAIAAVLVAPARRSTAAVQTDNQRVFFDIDPTGCWLASGSGSSCAGGNGSEKESSGPNSSSLGVIHIWDVSEDGLARDDAVPLEERRGTMRNEKRPRFSFKGHGDQVTTAAFHPFYPILMSSAGSRRAAGADSDSEEEQEERDSVWDSSIKLWDLR